MVFETYSESKSLSSKTVEKYFRLIISDSKIIEVFGHVEADVIRSYGAVDRILSLQNLRELRVILRRPNPEDVSGSLYAEIEEMLSSQDSHELEQVLRSAQAIKPNERTKKLSFLAAENGELKAKNLEDGIIVNHSTEESPLKLSRSYNSETDIPSTIFEQLASELIETISSKRRDL